MENLYMKNRLFLKNGHDCDFADDLDKVPVYVPGNDIASIIKRRYLRWVIISETNAAVQNHFRSQGAIALEKNRQLRRHVFIIHPFSDIRKYWELIMLVVFLGEFFIIPLDLSFYATPYSLDKHVFWRAIKNILDIFCIFDIVLSFLTGYYDESRKKIVLTPQLMAINFLRTFFFVDLLSSIPIHFEFMLEANSLKSAIGYIHLIALLKFFRLRTFVKYLGRAARTYRIDFTVHSGLTIAICYGLYFHFICCILLYLNNISGGSLTSSVEDDEEGNMLTLKQHQQYLKWFYRSCMVTTNASYGEGLPSNSAVGVIVIVFFFISRLVQIHLTSRIAEIIKARTSAQHKYVEMVRQLREYMRHNQLPEYVQRRLITYYEFRFQKSYFRESEILNTISGQLRQEITMSSCRKLVENVGFFKNLPLGLLVRIVSSLQLEVFLINDVIIRANTPGNSMYFISSGTVAIFTNTGKEVCHLEDGAHFGEIALVVPGQLRVASVVAVEICELYRLERKEFVKAIFPYPDLLDNIQRIAADRTEKTQRLDEAHKREGAEQMQFKDDDDKDREGRSGSHSTISKMSDD